MNQVIHRQSLEVGDRISVHMNLNNGLLTVKSREKSLAEYNKVIQHRRQPVCLKGPEFRVQDAVLQRIRETGQREVCAYVIGEFAGEHKPPENKNTESVYFHPMKCSNFVSGGMPIENGERFWCWLEEKGKPRMEVLREKEPAHA